MPMPLTVPSRCWLRLGAGDLGSRSHGVRSIWAKFVIQASPVECGKSASAAASAAGSPFMAQWFKALAWGSGVRAGAFGSQEFPGCR